jgi:chaperonin cofactor prefoldin
MWREAMSDALQCVDKDPKFVKGYIRLAIAQTELEAFDDAETTLKAALTLDPSNKTTGEQLRKLKAKKQEKVGGGAKQQQRPAKVLDEAQRRELAELQEQTNVHMRDLRGVMMRMGSIQREAAACQNTTRQVGSLNEDAIIYRSVGKAYIKTNKAAQEAVLSAEIETYDKNYKVTDHQTTRIKKSIQLVSKASGIIFKTVTTSSNVFKLQI